MFLFEHGKLLEVGTPEFLNQQMEDYGGMIKGAGYDPLMKKEGVFSVYEASSERTSAFKAGFPFLVEVRLGPQSEIAVLLRHHNEYFEFMAFIKGHLKACAILTL